MRYGYLIIILLFSNFSNTLQSQNIDTISNWDGIVVDWSIYAGNGQVVANPEQQGINPSAQCLEITTNADPYNFMFTDFDSPVNFEEFPIYRLKILAPESGGQVLLKFENAGNTSSQEIALTPIPGQWDDLEFDFSETTASDYIRMVVFFDFQGTTPDKLWYIDDILRVGTNTGGLSSNLPIVIINTGGMEIPDEPKIDGYMGIIDNGPGQINNQYDPFNDYDGFIGIELRGQSSQYYFPKKSYGFETRDEQGENLNVSLLGMPEENDWILYAPYSDKSMLRNFMTFYIGSKLDPYCTRMAYCEVIVNDDYKGVYILMEKIKKDENRVNIAKLKPEDISGDELTGGYILRVDKIRPDFVLGEDGWKSYPSPPYPDAMNITFQYYYPDPDDMVSQQKTYIKNYISSAENALTGSNFSNKDFGYNRYFNTGSFIDQMIVNEISKEVDNYRYSTYFHKEKDSDGGKLFAGPAWDFNLGYSNVDYWPPGNEYSGWLYSMVEPVDWGIMFWWKRLMEDSYFRDLFKTRWRSLRNNELTNENLQFAIDSITTYIDDAQQRNYERWPILGEYVWPNYDWWGNDYDDEVDFFENWFFNRLGWMDYNVSGILLYPSAEISGNLPDIEIELTDDYFSRQILKKKYFTLNNAPPGMSIDTVIYVNAAQAIIKLLGNVNGSAEISVTMKSKILNSFDDLTSSTLSVGVGFTPYTKPNVVLFTSQHNIYLECSQPELLGNRMGIFNLSGQLVKTVHIEKKQLNTINIQLQPGIYVCSFTIEGRKQSQRMVFVR